MSLTQLVRIPYTWRGGPNLGGSITDVVGYLRTELQNIQRGIPVALARTVTADYTALATDDLVLADATSGAITVTLPPAGSVAYQTLTIKKIDASANAVTIGGTVDGAASPTLPAQYNSITIQSDGSAWYQLASV